MGGDVDVVLLAGTAVLLAAVAGVRLSSHLGVPSLLIYLALGMLLGQDVLGLRFDNTTLARDLGLVALALILAEGGLTTRWSDIRPVVPAAAVLSTAGVAVSIGITCVAARFVLDEDWRTSALAAAVLASTDAAAVFATLRLMRLPRRLVGLLEAESGLNDAPAVIVVTLLASRHPHGAGRAVLSLLYELGVGAAVGVVVGWAAAAGLRRAALPATGLYPIATLTCALASYAAAAAAGASGFLAIYLTALWLGNARLPHRRSTVGFANGVAWLAQIGLFIMLGVLVTPDRLGHALLPALGIGAVLLLVARPVSVFVSTVAFGYSSREQLLLSTAGLRGAVPIVLATIPLTTHVHGAQRIFDVVFVLVALFTALQAPLIAPLARRLRLDAGNDGRDLDVDAAPLDRIEADLLTVRVPVGSRMHRVEVWELDLPIEASLVFIIRDGHGIVPEQRTTLREHDDLMLVVPRMLRDRVEQRLRAVSRSGRLARFYGDEGSG